MTIIRPDRRTVLKSLAATGGAALLGGRTALAQTAPAAADLAGFRDKIDHIVVIYQENRSFDHYFGTYRHPRGSAVENLLDADGKVGDRFTDLQKNPAGVPYSPLPMPDDVPGLQRQLFSNRPFALAPYVPAGDNVPWDPQHHFFRMFAQIDGGRMDRFVALALAYPHAAFDKAAEADALAMTFAELRPSGAVLGYYERADLPDYYRLADEYVLFDRFFQAMSGGSTGNAFYLVAGRSAEWKAAPQARRGSLTPPVFDMPYDGAGVLINDVPPINGPTETNSAALKLAPPPDEQTYANIGDRLVGAGLSWAWYNEDWNRVKPWALKTAFGAGDGSVVVDTVDTYVPHRNPFQYYPSWFANVRAGRMRDEEDFFTDIKAGRLPNVAFLKPTGAHDEHPATSAPRWGEQWAMRILRAIGESPAWSRTAVVITYDEGGGFWDHVAPPRPDAYGCGTRVPSFLVSAWARQGYVDHRVADTTSVTAMIAARFGLTPLQARDAAAYNLLDGLDFAQRPREPAFG